MNGIQFSYMYNIFLLCTIADGLDYTGGLLTATFSGSNITSVPVLTLPNEVAERVKKLTAVIHITANATRDGRVTHGSPDTATVQIDDDDSKLILLISIHILAIQSHLILLLL